MSELNLSEKEKQELREDLREAMKLTVDLTNEFMPQYMESIVPHLKPLFEEYAKTNAKAFVDELERRGFTPNFSR